MTWVHRPEQSKNYHSSQEGEGGYSPDNISKDGPPFVMSNANPTRLTSSKQECQTGGSTMPRFGMTLPHSTGDPGVDQWILSLLASPVLSQEQWFCQNMDINQSNLYLLEIKSLHISEDGEWSHQPCVEMVQRFVKSALKDAQKYTLQKNIRYTLDFKEDCGITKRGGTIDRTPIQNGSKQKTSFQENIESVMFFQIKESQSFQKNTGGWLVDTWPMDGESKEKKQDQGILLRIQEELLSVVDTIKETILLEESQQQDFMRQRSVKSPWLNFTSQIQNSIGGLSNLDTLRMGKRFQSAVLNWIGKSLHNYFSDGQREMDTAWKQTDRNTGASPQLVNHSCWVWLWLPDALTELFQQLENTKCQAKQQSREDLLIKESSTFLLSPTEIGQPLLMVDIHGNLSEIIQNTDMIQFTTLPSRKTNLMWRTEQLHTTANRSQQPENENLQQTPETAGLTPFVLLEKFNHHTSSSKTSVDSSRQSPITAHVEVVNGGMMPDGTLFTAHSVGPRFILPQRTLFDTSVSFSETWPKAGMMLSGECYLLPKWAHRIDGKGYGLSLYDAGQWPTPKASDGEWGTPRTSGRPIERVGHLGTAVKFWRTPSASYGEGGVMKMGDGDGRYKLRDQVQEINRDYQPGNTNNSKFWLTPSVMQIGTSPGRREKRTAYRESIGRKDVPGSLLEQVQTQKFWPTITANVERLLELTQTQKFWPTITVSGNYNRKGASVTSGDGLATAVNKFPTPTSRDYRSPHADSSAAFEDKKNNSRGVNLVEDCQRKNNVIGGTLNPDWVEWLMNWPIGWTQLEPLPVERMQEWLELTTSGEWWEIEPDIPRTIPPQSAENRASRLKALGNGQVPLQAAVAWELLNEKMSGS